MSEPSPARGPEPAGSDAAPDAALADVWLLLDELPRGTASAALTATTIEMAAVAADAAARGGSGSRRQRRAWLGPAAAVAAALVAGAVAGRLTAPDPDRLLLEHLPVVRHLDLVREAGSTTFLKEVAGRGGPPLRLLLRQGPEAARQDASAFTAAVESLGRLARADTAGRRAVVAALAIEERAELERSLREFATLSGAERKTLTAVADALVDPARPELRAAALDWHRWLAVTRPEDRADIVGSNTDKRLDWIDWYAARIEGRGRPGAGDRPPPGRWPPGGEPPRGPDGRMRRPPPRGPGPESREGPPREGPPPPPFRPDGAPPPRESRAPPG